MAGEKCTDEHAHASVLGVEDLVLVVALGEVILLGPPVKSSRRSAPRLHLGAPQNSPKVLLLVPSDHLSLLGNIVRHIPQNILPILILLAALLNNRAGDDVDLMLDGEEAERLEPVLCAFVGSRLSLVLVVRWLGEGPELLVGDDALRAGRPTRGGSAAESKRCSTGFVQR